MSREVTWHEYVFSRHTFSICSVSDQAIRELINFPLVFCFSLLVFFLFFSFVVFSIISLVVRFLLFCYACTAKISSKGHSEAQRRMSAIKPFLHSGVFLNQHQGSGSPLS